MLSLIAYQLFAVIVLGIVLPEAVLKSDSTPQLSRNVSTDLFNELEELARIVDISYCIGSYGTGIQKPFGCASHCSEFKNFELVSTWSTGHLMSDSCGYIVLSHPPSPPRIILAFRGTYSMANTIADLSTIPQEYVPYPADGGDQPKKDGLLPPREVDPSRARCTNCTVHSGFMRSWDNTKPQVLPHVEELIDKYPGYQLTLVGHSLGGAVAALASLDFHARGWNPRTTTFGEPRLGNYEFAQYLDKSMEAQSGATIDNFRRVTHVDDPVPLLPLTEWGFRSHAGEIYISKPELPPSPEDLQICLGDADPACLAEDAKHSVSFLLSQQELDADGFWDWWKETKGSLSIPTRWKLWQIFFRHRDYFWRLGLCVPWNNDRWDRELANRGEASHEL